MTWDNYVATLRVPFLHNSHMKTQMPYALTRSLGINEWQCSKIGRSLSEITRQVAMWNPPNGVTFPFLER
jgi:hypothetical protein